MRALMRQVPGAPGPDADRAAAPAEVAMALASLRQAASLPALFRHGAGALCEEMGFRRAAVFSLRDHTLVAESVHVRRAPDEGRQLLGRLCGAPPRLRPSLHESEALRRRTTLLVSAGDARALATLPGTRSYVVAPVICEAQAIALVHADNAPLGRAVTELDRIAVWAFAEGFGHALERCVLQERLRRHSDRVLALVHSAEASVEELMSPGLALPAGVARIPRNQAAGMPERGRLEMLTRREHEVLAMLAEGETNARIAQRLVVSEDTVKTHVKHILRKLAVHNRSQAVCRYFQGRDNAATSALG